MDCQDHKNNQTQHKQVLHASKKQFGIKDIIDSGQNQCDASNYETDSLGISDLNATDFRTSKALIHRGLAVLGSDHMRSFW